MRDQLIGYLLDALEPTEHQMVEAHLARDPGLQRELQLLSRSLLPLACDKEHFEPPLGLAQRTCAFVVQHAAQVTLPPAVPAPRQWSMADMVVAAGIFVAATMLFFPAISQSRFAARVTACQDNLRQVGVGMSNYSTYYKEYFPDVPLEGRLSAAGAVAVRLYDLGYLSGPRLIVCPASALADEAQVFRVPTPDEVQSKDGSELAKIHARMGGSYGYNIGYVWKGHYCTPKNLHRTRFAIVADAPNSSPPYHSLNHNGCGQNVLFEDQHVQYLTTCKARGCTDNIYVNDRGEVGPGLHVHDSVIGPSHSKPSIAPELMEIRAGSPQ